MNNNFYIDFHVLQTVPPSCVNRDDTNIPKTAYYGGTLRSRVSSQAWKHAMREYFNVIFPEEMKGYRTKKLPAMISECIVKEHGLSEAEADKAAEDVLKACDMKVDDKKDVLFFISAAQIRNIADLAVKLENDTEKDKKHEKELIISALQQNPSIDQALFGRMSASNPELNYDASAQVAHSISTHTITNEFDYFTAVDDCADEDNAGAAHIGTVEFNSSTLYRYANINVNELSDYLSDKEQTALAVKGFAEAFIKSMPTGHENSFANRTIPCLVYVTVRTDQPVNLCGAFEKPVYAGDDGYEQKSVRALREYSEHVYQDFVSKPDTAFVVGYDWDADTKRVSTDELLSELYQTVMER